MSSSSGSPAAMTRSSGSWWGEALWGPLATIQKLGAVVALAPRGGPDLARDVRLACGRRAARATMPSTARSAAARRPAAAPTSSASLTRRSGPITRTATPKAASGIGRLEPQQERGAQPVRDDEPAPPSRPATEASHDEGDTGPRSPATAGHRTRARPPTPGAASAAPTSSRGTTIDGSPVGGHDEQVEPLQGLGRVARQPLELGSDADEQRPDAGARARQRAVARCEPLRVARAGGCPPLTPSPLRGSVSHGATSARAVAGRTCRTRRRAAPRRRGRASASRWSSCCATAMTGRPRRGDAPDRLDAVVAVPEQVDDGAHDAARVGVVGIGLLEPTASSASSSSWSRAHAHRRGPGPLDGLDQARGPDEVIRDDRDEAAGRRLGRVDRIRVERHAPTVPRRAGRPERAQVRRPCQVSPANSSLRRSPSPLAATAVVDLARHELVVGGPLTRRRTPTGTGNSGRPHARQDVRERRVLAVSSWTSRSASRDAVRPAARPRAAGRRRRMPLSCVLAEDHRLAVLEHQHPVVADVPAR